MTLEKRSIDTCSINNIYQDTIVLTIHIQHSMQTLRKCTYGFWRFLSKKGEDNERIFPYILMENSYSPGLAMVREESNWSTQHDDWWYMLTYPCDFWFIFSNIKLQICIVIPWLKRLNFIPHHTRFCISNLTIGLHLFGSWEHFVS